MVDFCWERRALSSRSSRTWGVDGADGTGAKNGLAGVEDETPREVKTHSLLLGAGVARRILFE